MLKYFKFMLIFTTLMTSLPLFAIDEYTLTIQNHRFTPQELTIPANKKVKLIIQNMDSSPEEFESYDLNREKIISGNTQGIIFIGPLKSGEYKFFGEFNPDTAQGIITVKEFD